MYKNILHIIWQQKFISKFQILQILSPSLEQSKK